MKIDYKVLADYTQQGLEKQVNELCADGFMPQGGVSIAIAANKLRESYLKGGGMIQENEAVYTQAVVKVTEVQA